jgi:hypothetical protein
MGMLGSGDVMVLACPGLHGRESLCPFVAKVSREHESTPIGPLTLSMKIGEGGAKLAWEHLSREFERVNGLEQCDTLEEALHELDELTHRSALLIDTAVEIDPSVLEWLVASVHSFAERREHGEALSVWITGGYALWESCCHDLAPYQLDSLLPRQLEEPEVRRYLIATGLTGESEPLDPADIRKCVEDADGDAFTLSLVLEIAETLHKSVDVPLRSALTAARTLVGQAGFHDTQLWLRLCELMGDESMRATLEALTRRRGPSWSDLPEHHKQRLFDAGVVSMRPIGPEVAIRVRSALVRSWVAEVMRLKLGTQTPGLPDQAIAGGLVGVGTKVGTSVEVVAQYEGVVDRVEGERCLVRLRDLETNETLSGDYPTEDLRQSGVLERGRFAVELTRTSHGTIELRLRSTGSRIVRAAQWDRILRRTADLGDSTDVG